MNNKKKLSNIFVCSKCDAQFSKWSGRCLECGTWGTLNEEIVDKEKNKIENVKPAEIIDLSKIKSKQLERIKTNTNEIDRVFGGGIVPGSLVLLAGEPGIGKSTMVAQIADKIARENKAKKVLYISGEESATQIKDRLERLKCDINNINFISETNVEKILATIIKNTALPLLIIIDSIQTVYSSEIPGEAGSVNQIRATTVKFLEIAKKHNIPIMLIGHITKDGQVAGPKTLEHIVDTVIYLETENTHNYRIMRGTKNRFGSIDELGIFAMKETGFEEIKNPSALFVDEQTEEITGSVISSIMKGTRPFLIEIQALVTKTVFGYPQRKTSGFDLNRLQVLASVLTKRAKVNLTNQDIILNIVGGMRISEPSLDLAVCLAIISSLSNQKISKKTIVLGEVGLGGEVRRISNLEQKLKEAEKLGFNKAIIPSVNNLKIKNIQVEKISTILDLKTSLLTS